MLKLSFAPDAYALHTKGSIIDDNSVRLFRDYQYSPWYHTHHALRDIVMFTGQEQDPNHDDAATHLILCHNDVANRTLEAMSPIMENVRGATHIQKHCAAIVLEAICSLIIQRLPLRAVQFICIKLEIAHKAITFRIDELNRLITNQATQDRVNFSNVHLWNLVQFGAKPDDAEFIVFLATAIEHILNDTVAHLLQTQDIAQRMAHLTCHGIQDLIPAQRLVHITEKRLKFFVEFFNGEEIWELKEDPSFEDIFQENNEVCTPTVQLTIRNTCRALRRVLEVISSHNIGDIWTAQHIRLLNQALDTANQEIPYDYINMLFHLRTHIDFQQEIWTLQHGQILCRAVRSTQIHGHALLRVLGGLSSIEEELVQQTLSSTHKKLYSRNKRMGAMSLLHTIKLRLEWLRAQNTIPEEQTVQGAIKTTAKDVIHILNKQPKIDQLDIATQAVDGLTFSSCP